MTSRRSVHTLLGPLVLVGVVFGLGALPGPAGEPAKPASHAGCRLLVPPHDASGDVQVVRYDPSSGRTWTREDGFEGDVFAEVAESGPVPPGPYAVEAAVLEASEVQLARLHEATGRTWAAYAFARGGSAAFDADDEEYEEYEGPDPAAPDPAERRWVAVLEPEGAPAPAESAPSGASPAHVLRMASNASTAWVLRGRREDGRTWMAVQGRWQEVGDSAPPGPGLYDWALVLLPKATPALLRLEARTGRVWRSTGGQPWQLAGEGDPAAAPAPAPPGEGPYEWIVRGTNRDAHVVRFHAATGRLWVLGRAWARVTEEREPPPGPYRFALSVGDGDVPPRAVRLDPVTGETWVANLAHAAWESRHPAVIDRRKAGPFGPPRFEVRTSAASPQARAVRFDRTTGAASVIDGEGRLADVMEPAPPPTGDYDVLLEVSGTGRPYLLRLERRSGAWWVATPVVWTRLAGLPASSADAPSPRFAQRAMGTAERVGAARIDVRTGDVRLWQPERDPPHAGPAKASAEPSPPAAGDYLLDALVWSGVRKGSTVTMVRFDQTTGRAWYDGLVGPLENLVQAWVEIR